MDLDGIVEICDVLGLRIGKVRSTGFVSVSCPLAQFTHSDPDDRNCGCSITLNAAGPSYAYCFSSNCDFRGPLFMLLQRRIRLLKPPPPRELELLAKVVKAEEVTVERRCVLIAESVEHFIPQLSFSPVPSLPARDRAVEDESVLDPFKRPLPSYAAERGITEAAAVAWGLGYDETTGRLVFPVRRRDGALVGMTGRLVPGDPAAFKWRDDPPKYFNYRGLNKALYLYGAHLWKPGLPIVLVEGPVDAIRTWMALGEVANVAATLGEGFSHDHRRLINTAWPPSVYIFTDGDSAGRRLAQKINIRLHDLVPNYMMECAKRTTVMPDGTTQVSWADPGEMTDDEIRAAFAGAEILLGCIG